MVIRGLEDFRQEMKMTEQFDNEHSIQEEENFADLIDSYCAGMNDNIRTGDKIQGKIVSIGTDSVFIDTGTKIDGVVDKKELTDEDGQFSYHEGDVVELYVTSLEESEIRLSKALTGVSGVEVLKEAFGSQIPVEGKVKGPCKGGFQVVVLNNRAFCPSSQMDISFAQDPEHYSGETYRFLITRFEQGGKNIVVSRRQLLEKELEKEKQSFVEQLETGSVVEGRVRTVMPYGAFVEVFPGVDGLVHISQLSWARVEKPENVVNVGDRVRVKVLSVEKGKPNQLKLSLSIKQAGPDPWDSIGEELRAGDKIEGRVTRCAKFGAFVEIKPGIEGLLHISELSYARRILKPEDVVLPGDNIIVLVKELDPDNRKISLSLKDVDGDPWARISNTYRPGQTIEGVLEKKEKFGYFVSLEPGITGLIPASKISRMADPGLLEKRRAGDKIRVVVDQIHTDEHKISLSPADEVTENEWKKFSTEKSDDSEGLGALGAKLKQALEGRDKE